MANSPKIKDIQFKIMNNIYPAAESLRKRFEVDPCGFCSLLLDMVNISNIYFFNIVFILCLLCYYCVLLLCSYCCLGYCLVLLLLLFVCHMSYVNHLCVNICVNYYILLKTHLMTD